MFVLKGRRNGGDLLAFSPDGRTLAARYEGGLQLWRGLPEPDYQAIPTATIGWMQFSPDGRTLYLDGHQSGAYDLAAGTFTELPNPEGSYRFLALSPDGRWVVAVCMPLSRPASEHSYRCWRPDQVGTGRPRWTAPLIRAGAGRPLPLPDGRFVVLEYTGQSCRWVRRSKTGKPQAESPPFDRFPNWEAVSPDGVWVAGARGNEAAAWSVARLSRPPVTLRNDSKKDFTDVTFHPPGRYLALSSNDGTVKLYDTATWQPARTYDWRLGKLTSVAFSPDGTLAAAGTGTGRVVVWDFDL